MTVERDKILAFLDGKSDRSNAAVTADILCRPPGQGMPVTVVDDGATEPDDGKPEREMIAPCRPAEGPPRMCELPAYVLNEPWIRQGMQARLGRDKSTSFHACLYDLGFAASEPVYLALVLREAYGPDEARRHMDAAVFAQPAYGPLKQDVGPILERYVYC